MQGPRHTLLLDWSLAEMVLLPSAFSGHSFSNFVHTFFSWNAKQQIKLHPSNISTVGLLCTVLHQTFCLQVIVRKIWNSQSLVFKKIPQHSLVGKGEAKKPQTTKEKKTVKSQRHQHSVWARFLDPIFPWETRFTYYLHSCYLQYQLVTHVHYYSRVCSCAHCWEDRSKGVANAT